MALEKIADKVIETDVLVVGGGLAGCPAAAKAREHGLNVTLIEKAKIDRSGGTGHGIDHYPSFGVETRGVTTREFLANWENIRRRPGVVDELSDPTKNYRVYVNQFWAIEELEKLGVSMRWDDGKYYGPIKCQVGEQLRVHWMNVKPDMALIVRKRDVNVLNRVMVVDLLTNKGAVVGVTALNTRTGEFIIIKAKATVIATGCAGRCFMPSAPDPWKYKFRYHYCPASLSGDGWSAAYRAGAELANMEQTAGGHLISDESASSYGNFPENDGIPSKFLSWDGEELPINIIPTVGELVELEQKAKDPFYYSLEHLPDDFHRRMEVAMADEWLLTLKAAEERGFNPRTHWYEVMPNRPWAFRGSPGIDVDANFMTTLKGLYAIGDAIAGGRSCSNAIISGLLVGDSINTFVSDAGEPVVDEAQVETQRQTALAPLTLKDGTEPMELECAIRYICDRYTGVLRSEGRLRGGMMRLGTLRRVFLPKLMAKNPHYLMRCLECRNVMDLAEMHMRSCLERTETRGDFFRLDYPKKNPSFDGMVVYQRMEEGKAVCEMRKLKPLNMEFKEER